MSLTAIDPDGMPAFLDRTRTPAKENPMKEVAKREPQGETPTLPALLTPMEMLNRAVSQGASIEVLEKLMGLQERWEASQARKAFDAAIAEAKAEIKPIARNREGHNSKRYADFAAYATAIDPILGKHGLSYRFRSRQDERIHVTCVLSHKLGHYEETTLAGPPDNTGSKNAIQAIGSTLTYLQRYSLVQALGLAAADDDDGKGAGGAPVSEAQLDQLRVLITDIGADVPKFCKYMATTHKVSVEKLEDIPAALFQKAMDALNAKRKKS